MKPSLSSAGIAAFVVALIALASVAALPVNSALTEEMVVLEAAAPNYPALAAAANVSGKVTWKFTLPKREPWIASAL